MVGSYIALVLFGFFITPYKIDFFESLFLLLCCCLYFFFLILNTKNDNFPIEKDEKKVNIVLSIIITILGLIMIIWGGNLVVNSASSIAVKLGMSETLVGLTIVAIGTSLPELVTSVVASIKKENDIAVGNIIGSCILNTLFILGLTGSISSLTLVNSTLFDMIVMLISGVIILVISLLSKNIKRWHGVVIFLLYVLYLVYIIIRN